jgi:hypothetical protein
MKLVFLITNGSQLLYVLFVVDGNESIICNCFLKYILYSKYFWIQIVDFELCLFFFFSSNVPGRKHSRLINQNCVVDASTFVWMKFVWLAKVSTEIRLLSCHKIESAGLTLVQKYIKHNVSVNTLESICKTERVYYWCKNVSNGCLLNLYFIQNTHA